MMIQNSGGSTGVLDRPATAIPRMEITKIEEDEELEQKLGRAKSSLTVVENPSLDGNLGILMAATTILNGDEKAFLDAYIIIADQHYAITEVRDTKMAKTGRQTKEPFLYIIHDVRGVAHPVGSSLPYEICKITDEEFRKYEATLKTAGNPNGFAGVVNDMVRLLGERVPLFSLDNGKLVLPPNYANIRLQFPSL